MGKEYGPMASKDRLSSLRAFLSSLKPAEQLSFAARCGTTLGYIRKKLSTGGRFGESLVIAFERESGGAVRCEELRPDVDWAYLRGTSNSPGASPTIRRCG